MRSAERRDLLARLQQPGSARVLALVRIAVCVHVASVLMSPALELIFVVPAHVMPWAKSILPEWLEQLATRHLPSLVQLGLLGSLFGMLGLFTRVALPLTAICFFFTQDVWFRLSLFHDDWLYFNAYLAVLAFSPSGDAWSIDAWRRRRRGQPAAQGDLRHRLACELMTLWFAGIYVAAGLAKVFPLVKAWGWLSGARAQEFACEFMLDSPLYWWLGRPPFDYTAHRFPFALAALYTVFAELGAATLVLTDRSRWLVLPAILGMHTAILLLGIPGFVQAALIAMTVFVPPGWLGEAPARSLNAAA